MPAIMNSREWVCVVGKDARNAVGGSLAKSLKEGQGVNGSSSFR
jgi:hypothetical protein